MWSVAEEAALHGHNDVDEQHKAEENHETEQPDHHVTGDDKEDIAAQNDDDFDVPEHLRARVELQATLKRLNKEMLQLQHRAREILKTRMILPRISKREKQTVFTVLAEIFEEALHGLEEELTEVVDCLDHEWISM